MSLACCSTDPVEALQVKLKQPKTIFVREIQFGIRKMATSPRWNLQSILFSFPRPCVPLFSVSQSENCTSILQLFLHGPGVRNDIRGDDYDLVEVELRGGNINFRAQAHVSTHIL